MDYLTATVLLAATVAGWDALRRYFLVRQFNQAIVAEVNETRREVAELRQQIQNIGQRLTLQAGSVSTRNPARIVR